MNEENVCWARQLVVLAKVAIRAGQPSEALEILDKARFVLDDELGFDFKPGNHENEKTNNNEPAGERLRPV